MENLQVKCESIKRNDVPNILKETANAPCKKQNEREWGTIIIIMLLFNHKHTSKAKKNTFVNYMGAAVCDTISGDPVVFTNKDRNQFINTKRNK